MQRQDGQAGLRGHGYQSVAAWRSRRLPAGLLLEPGDLGCHVAVDHCVAFHGSGPVSVVDATSLGISFIRSRYAPPLMFPHALWSSSYVTRPLGTVTKADPARPEEESVVRPAYWV